jgi:glucose/arabinose dehydrogenase
VDIFVHPNTQRVSLNINKSKHSAYLLLLPILLTLTAALVLSFYPVKSLAGSNFTANAPVFNISTIAEGLEHPWGMAFLPNGDILVTERAGRLRLIKQGKLLAEAIKGLPPIAGHGQGGLLDVALHPDYKNNGWIYFSYAASEDGFSLNTGTEVGRGRLKNNRIVDWQHLFRLKPKTGKRQHFGSRLVFDRDNKLYITLGDRGERFRAQDLNDHAGSIIRLNDDGSIPGDNPFVGETDKQAGIYSYGHRNIQGAVLNPETGKLWTHEHGPQGGDELNIIEAGKNYGWPIITYGKEYGSGDDIGEGTHKAGMQQPLYHWVPSIAPSGMAFYNGDKFPDWQGNLFIGSLKFKLLVRLKLDGSKVISEQRLLKNKLGRIRDVQVGTDGYIYLLTDATNGKLVRIQP